MVSKEKIFSVLVTMMFVLFFPVFSFLWYSGTKEHLYDVNSSLTEKK